LLVAAWVAIAALPAGGAVPLAPAAREVPASEFGQRRAAALKRVPDGLLLIPARAFRFHSDQDYLAGFQQAPNFYYFTGLASAAGAVLLLDGAAHQTWLFVPARLPGLAGHLQRLRVEPGEASATALFVEHVTPRSELAGFLRRRLAERPGLYLYTAEPAGSGALTLDAALDEPEAAWEYALAALWPAAQRRSAAALIAELRAVKSDAELAALRRVGQASAEALRAGLRALHAGRSQRQAEAAVVAGCLAAGAEGPSFWPWVMAGVNSGFPAPMESLADYRHLNRIMKAGEVARVDVGCDVDHYKGDVGRTAPVGGAFDAGQRETWELLVAAYRAGLATLRDGVKPATVLAASLAEIQRCHPDLRTPLGRKAGALLLKPDGLSWWQLHGVGLESAEQPPETLRAGMVIDFEPMFTVEGHGFYLEDMILITRTGYEILTPGLPYTAAEVERVIGQGL
jgi:Xaa-Pro aminopeptidase